MADKTIPAGPTYRAPQLADAINSLEIKDPKIPLDCSQFKAPGESGSKPSLSAKEIKPILTHIIRRLREGLDKCWATTEGKGDFANPSASEEAWARQVTEMLLCTPYAGPGVSYLRDPAGDHTLYQQVQGGKAFPIIFACQHLCDFGAMSRGFDFGTMDENAGKKNKPPKIVPIHFDAATSEAAISLRPLGQTADLPPEERGFICGPKVGRAPTDPPDRPKETKMTSSLEVKDAIKRLFAEGCTYAFSKPRHIGFALRVDPARNFMQFFDTSAMGAPPANSKGPPVKLYEKFLDKAGQQDFNWCDRVTGPSGGKATFHSFGILPKAKGLDAAVARLKKLRPLGFARLKLIWRATGEVLFVSPLLLMHNGSDNFPISRFIYSLRHMPGRDCIDGIWMIDIPNNAFDKKSTERMTDQMLAADRTATIRDLVTRGGLKPLATSTVKFEDGTTQVRKHVLQQGKHMKTVLHLSTALDWDEKFKEKKGSFAQGRVRIDRRCTSVICMVTKKKPDGTPEPGPDGKPIKTPFTIDIMGPVDEREYDESKFPAPADWQKKYNEFLPSLVNWPWDMPSGSVQMGAADFSGELSYFNGDWDGTSRP